MSSRLEHQLTQLLGEVQQLHRELLEQRYLRRSDGIERVREAVRRLGEVGSPAGIIARSAEELGTSAEFDLVLISRIDDGHIRAQSLWSRQGQADADRAFAELSSRPISLRYPLIEEEVAQRRQSLIVSVSGSRGRAPREFLEILDWRSYALAPITLEGTTVGLLHAGRAGITSELGPDRPRAGHALRPRARLSVRTSHASRTTAAPARAAPIRRPMGQRSDARPFQAGNARNRHDCCRR